MKTPICSLCLEEDPSCAYREGWGSMGKMCEFCFEGLTEDALMRELMYEESLAYEEGEYDYET